MFEVKVTVRCSRCKSKAKQVAEYEQVRWPISGVVRLSLNSVIPRNWAIHQDYVLCHKCAAKIVDVTPVITPNSV